MALMDLEIASKENSHFQELKKISLGENNDYLFIEGKKLFLEAINSPFEIKKIFINKKIRILYQNFFQVEIILK